MLKLWRPRFKSARRPLNFKRLSGTAAQNLHACRKILIDTAERRDSGVWVFKFIRRTGRSGACGELLNFASELSHGGRTQEF